MRSRSSRCRRCSPRTAAWSPPCPRPWTSPSASRPSRSGWSSTRTTCGGTTRLPAQIARAGAGGRIDSFQLADWITPLPAGVLVGRGQLGDGSVDFRALAELVEAAGFDGPIEVEIFNEELWARDGVEVVAEVAARYTEHAC